MPGGSLCYERYIPWPAVCGRYPHPCTRCIFECRRVSAAHHFLLRIRARQHQIPRRLNPPHLILSFLHVSLRIIVHPQPEECQEDAHSLNRVYALLEPHDRDAYDRYALDKRCDRVCYRRCGRQNNEGYDVLGKVNGAIHEDIVGHGVRVRMTVGWVRNVFNRGEEDGEVVVHPQWDHEQECHT